MPKRSSSHAKNVRLTVNSSGAAGSGNRPSTTRAPTKRLSPANGLGSRTGELSEGETRNEVTKAIDPTSATPSILATSAVSGGPLSCVITRSGSPPARAVYRSGADPVLRVPAARPMASPPAIAMSKAATNSCGSRRCTQTRTRSRIANISRVCVAIRARARVLATPNRGGYHV